MLHYHDILATDEAIMIWLILCNGESMWHSPLGVLNAERNCFYLFSVWGKIKEPYSSKKSFPVLQHGVKLFLLLSPKFTCSPIAKLEVGGLVGFDYMGLWECGIQHEIAAGANLDTYIYMYVWAKNVSCMIVDGVSNVGEA